MDGDLYDSAVSSPRHLYVTPDDLVESAGRGEAIQALTRDVLIRRSLEVSPNGFITIISIIQGVALRASEIHARFGVNRPPFN